MNKWVVWTDITSLWCLLNEHSCFLILPTLQRKINDKAGTPTFCTHHPIPKCLYTLLVLMICQSEEMDARSCSDQVAHPDSALPAWPSSLGSAPSITSPFLYLPHPPQSGLFLYGFSVDPSPSTGAKWSQINPPRAPLPLSSLLSLPFLL